ncbi:unnamed protein product [Natator depressus]
MLDIDCECLYNFIYLSFQEFFAAMSYVLQEDEGTTKDSGTPKKDVKTLLENYGNSRNYLMLTVRFLFGLLNEERMKDLEKIFSSKISPKIKPDLLKSVPTKKQTNSSFPSVYDELTSELEEFHRLSEIQEENFVTSALEHLTELHISQNELTQMDQMVLSFCVKHCHRLESFLISECSFIFEDHAEEELPRSTKWLYQEDCQDKPKHSSIYLLCQALKDPNCKLKKLEVFPVVISQPLVVGISPLFSMTELDLGWNKLGNSGMRLLCEQLNHPNCRNCGLECRDVTHGSCEDLAAVLRSSLSLTELELELELGANYSLRDAGVRLLCEGLKHPTCTLQRLGMWDCGFSAAGCRDLSSVLFINQTLTELDLGYNELGDSRVQLLCEALKYSTCKLEKLG